MNPIISELHGFVKSAESFLALRKRELEEEARPIVHAALMEKRELGEVVPDMRDLHLGWYWECPSSPTAHCVYNEAEDAIHDFCLFCDDPEERK